MTGDESVGGSARRLRAAQLLLGAVCRDDDAVAELVGRAMDEPYADYALGVLLELEIAELEGAGGLPQPERVVDDRLDAFVRSLRRH